MADKDKYKKPLWKMASITGAQTGLKEIFPGMGIKGGASKSGIKKHTPIRKEYAALKRAQHTKTKLLKRKETSEKLATQEAATKQFYKKYPGSKELFAKQKYSKSILRKEKQLKKIASK